MYASYSADLEKSLVLVRALADHGPACGARRRLIGCMVTMSICTWLNQAMISDHPEDYEGIRLYCDIRIEKHLPGPRVEISDRDYGQTEFFGRR